MEKENLKKLAKGLDELVEIGEAIAADGKVDFDDAGHALKLPAPAKNIYEALTSKDELVEELKAWLQEKIDELVE